MPIDLKAQHQHLHIAIMLPDEIIAQLDAEFQCRHQQIQHLAALYSVRKHHSPRARAVLIKHRRISLLRPFSTSTA